jgi:uncharacterized iron-regulated membrane protein
MEPTFRPALNWLHTWTGIVFGGLLFAIFWTGTLSVFDREIDAWMAPALRLRPAPEPLSLDRLHDSYATASRARAPAWSVTLPSERQPFFLVTWRGPSGPVELRLDPADGAPLVDARTFGGSGFLYPFHYTLHIGAGRVGQWIVGAAAMAMLALCVSGVVIHRRIFMDFFVFRAAARSRRWILDLHTVAGVTALPFGIAITLSGLTIAWPIYFPASLWAAHDGGRAAFNREAFGLFDRPRLGRPGELASLDGMAAAARDLWAGSPLRSISVRHPGDAGAYVQIVRREEAKVSGTTERAYFDGVSGTLLHRTGALGPALRADRFLAGLHEIQFRHWTLRWLYFGLGLASCALIATGHLFWLEARRKRHRQLGLGGVRLVEGLTVGSMVGIVGATFAFLAANRLLPQDIAIAGHDRAALEVCAFFIVWLASFAHAWLRPSRAWPEQCAVLAVLALAAVVLNGATSGDHLVRSLTHRHLWPIAGMDVLLLSAAAAATVAAARTARPAARSGSAPASSDGRR